MALFTAGQILTAAELNALNGFVRKTADQSIASSTVLTNDSELLYAIPAAGTYVVEVWLFATSAANAAGDLQVGFSFPSGSMSFGAQGPDASLTSGTVSTGQWGGGVSVTSGVTATQVGLSTAINLIHLHGILIATAAGSLRVMWAQLASNVSASTVKAGSHMLVRQVA